MTPEQQAIYLNAIPLLVVGLAYVAGAASLVPVFLRERARMRDLDLALALVFPCVGAAAIVLGLLVLDDRQPVGGHAWLGLAAIGLSLVPALAFFARFRDRSLLLTAPARVRDVEARPRAALTLDDAARELIDRATDSAGVEVGALVLVERDGTEGRVVLARERGTDIDGFSSIRIDLVNEPSGVTSAYHDAAPFAVFDARTSESVNPRLVERTGARSVAYVPLLAEQRVIAVLVVASTERQRVFSNDELARLQSIAADAAPAVRRLRRGAGSARGGRIEELAERVRSTDDLDPLLAEAVRQLGELLNAERCFVRLGEPGGAMSIKAQWHEPGLADVDGTQMQQLVASNVAARDRRTVAIADVARTTELEEVPVGALLELGSRSVLAVPILVFGRLLGTISVHRTAPGAWDNEDVAFLEAAARELGFGLQAAELVAEGERRIERQSALLDAAQVLASELELERVLERLVDQVLKVVGADAADCWLFDEQRRVLRCRAVRGLPDTEVGREIEPTGTIGEVIDGRRPVLRRDFARTERPPPSESYREFVEVMDAPVVVDGEVQGVLGLCSLRPNTFDDRDVDLLETFASLASLALRNAAAFEDRSRQARVQRGFYRIASVLGQSLSLPETLDALAHAASDALGGRFAAALEATPDGVDVVGSHGVPAPLLEAISAGADETGDALRLAADDRRVLASPRVVDDERFSPRWRALTETCGFASLLVVPVEAPRDDRAILVVVFFEDERRLLDEDLELAHHLAQAARGSLERSELFEGERASRALAQQLARTGGLLATELDPAAVLDEVVEHAPALLAADACAVRVVEGDELVVVAAKGSGADEAVGTRSGVGVWLAEPRAPVLVADARADPALEGSDPMLAGGHAAYLGVPLVGAEGTLHGVLAVYAARARAWRDEEVEALQALAANTAAALSNAELYQRVALEKERSAAILENIADGIVAVDRDGHVVLWNRAAEAVTGVPASEALGREPQQLLGRDLSGASLVPIVRGGGEIWLSVTEAVMHDPAGAVAGRIFAFRDISSERLVEEMKSEFVSTVSQELRGPLTSIFGFAETLLRQDVLFGEEERRVFLGYISSESARLTAIVDALLSVARLDTGDLHVDLAPTDVGQVVTEVVSSVGAGARNGHDFVVELPNEPIAAEADAEKLRQVLSHLLDNAVKYSPDGGRVTVTARRKTDTVEFHVADQGIGIPAGERERIFRKFYRADQARGGTGLGLFIVRGLVNAMGGRIWVESAEGEGSRFAFELPAARV